MSHAILVEIIILGSGLDVLGRVPARLLRRFLIIGVLLLILGYKSEDNDKENLVGGTILENISDGVRALVSPKDG